MPLPGRTVRFGPFQLDLHAAELHYNGSKIKLAEQPFQILAGLVQHPGEVVTRDELRQLLWHSDTFVDFEHGLNAAVKRLREVLDDSAESPRYIETIPRRGYRLMVPVESEVRVAAAVPRRRLGRWKIWLVGAVAGVVIAILAVGPVWQQRSRRVFALAPSDTIVIADFTNSTGDPVFDDALKQALTVQLEQSPFLNLISQEKMQDTLRLMGRLPYERLTPEVGRELCQRAGSKALLTGSIARLGSQYVIGLMATACKTGNLVAIEQEQAANKEGVLKALGKAASSLRSKLGESLPSVQKFEVPIEATTPSLEALRSYSMGYRIKGQKGDVSAIPFYQQAVELDPNFPLAYASLATAYFNLGESSRAVEYATKAYELRSRVSEPEKLHISGFYFMATGELYEAAQIYEMWIADYPRAVIPYANLGGVYSSLGQHDNALPKYREALRLGPDRVLNYSDLADAYRRLNRLDDAKATLDQALANKLDAIDLRVSMYHLAFLRGDEEQMEQQVTWAAGKPVEEAALLSKRSDTEAYYGRSSKARDLSNRSVNSAVGAQSKETAASWQVNAALREAELGNAALARQRINAALALSAGQDVKAQAALTLARIGDADRAQALAEQLEQNYPSNVLLKFYWLPTINAAIEISRGNSSQALVDLQAASPYELSQEGMFLVNSMYPVYVRGQAYLMMHNGPAATAEFQKLLDHRGIVLNYPLGALVHLQMGRAYAVSGETAKAKAAYRDFLTLWKDADANIPILKQAKAEYAKLQ